MSKSKNALHPRLAADCHQLGLLGDTRLLLHRNASLHWFILVPFTDTLDLLDLPPIGRETLLERAREVSEFLKMELNYPRVNVGALGLLVPQLHLHVIGRREDDPCWPDPVWGRLGDGPGYEPAQLQVIRDFFALS